MALMTLIPGEEVLHSSPSMHSSHSYDAIQGRGVFGWYVWPVLSA